MRVDWIEFLGRAAAALADSPGIRTGAASVIENLSRALSTSTIALIRRRRDLDVAETLASAGLGAADFRRLETRIPKSRLWHIFDDVSPLVVHDLGFEPVLDFWAFGTGTRVLIAVPVTVSGTVTAILAAGFPPSIEPEPKVVINLLQAIAAMISQSFRVDRSLNEQNRRLEDENLQLKQELREKYDVGQLIGNSGPMRRISDQVSQIARSNITILLRGESGTGKELVAHSIHYNSLRSKRPFVKLDCSAIPETMLENELFGIENSPQNGSVPKKIGCLESTDGGTLFLDEIGNLPIQTQSKILRVVNDRAFERVGGNSTITANVRLIASTARDIEDDVAERRFREDLFHRLSLFTIFLPPLRDRKSDILLLAEHFLARCELKHGKHIRRISTPAIDMLTAYHFPGNVRELENAIEQAVIACDNAVIHGHHLPPTLQTAENSGTETRVTLASTVEAFERDIIFDALKSTRGNVAKAAKMLSSTERILGYKIKKYTIDPQRFRK